MASLTFKSQYVLEGSIQKLNLKSKILPFEKQGSSLQNPAKSNIIKLIKEVRVEQRHNHRIVKLSNN